jgi:hypothetical protein
MMPGTGLAKTYPAPLQFVWKYILPAAAFQRNVLRPAKSGERLARLVSNGDALTSGKYYSDGQVKPSSFLSYNKENAIDLWNTSAEMVGLSPDISGFCYRVIENSPKTSALDHILENGQWRAGDSADNRS